MDDKKKLQIILEQAFDSLGFTIITDENGKILKMDQKYAESFNVTPEEAVGKYVTDVAYDSEIPRVLKTRKPERGNIFILKDGTPIVNTRIPIFYEGDFIGVISTTVLNSIEHAEVLLNQIKKLNEEKEEYRKKYLSLQQDNSSLDKIVGESIDINNAKELTKKVANSNLAILITGETGVGKELFANAIQQNSERRDKTYVKINCAAIPAELLESELFGYVPGAFSGASRQGKKGRFEMADKGTILLDEIGDMPLRLQSKLLRVIQEQEVEPVGALYPKKIDVRVICTTNCNLEKMVEEGTFRSDLFYRINTVEIKVPALRHRKDDIEALCDFFISAINHENVVHISGISQEAKMLLKKYDWPGNVRELRHCIERACIVKAYGELDTADFSFKEELQFADCSSPEPIIYSDAKTIKRIAEKKLIEETLEKTNGNKSKAAEMLGLSRSVFYRRLKEYDIK